MSLVRAPHGPNPSRGSLVVLRAHYRCMCYKGKPSYTNIISITTTVLLLNINTYILYGNNCCVFGNHGFSHVALFAQHLPPQEESEHNKRELIWIWMVAAENSRTVINRSQKHIFFFKFFFTVTFTGGYLYILLLPTLCT